MTSADAIYTDWPDALDRLNAILPLAARQAALAPPLRALHRQILARFAQTGQAPCARELVRFCDVPVADALASLQALDLVVLNRTGEISGAYPFTLETTPHRVTLPKFEINAMCSVDALAISPMTRQETVIHSVCHHCRSPISLTQRDEALGPSSVINSAQIGIAWRDTGGCAAHSLCREMVFFCNPTHARAWQAPNENLRCVLQPGHAIALAKAFFLPLLGS